MIATHIKHYISDGFVKVCDVEQYYSQWMYKNINEEIMYANHRSWIYFIVLDKEIVKIGETGQPLGIKMSDGQPKKGTECRLGRIRNGDNTDSVIRRSLQESLDAGQNVSIWALKCPIITVEREINGKKINVDCSMHKQLEYHYIDDFEYRVGRKPTLNVGRK